MKRRIRRIRRALKRAGLYNAFHITLIGGLVELGNIDQLIVLMKDAFQEALVCTNDPECNYLFFKCCYGKNGSYAEIFWI